MNDLTLSLIVGVTSSLTATALFISLSELTRRVLLPWYADKLYRGARVDGIWKVSILPGAEGMPEDAMILKLEQKGDAVSGHYQHQMPDGEITLYRLVGHLRDMYLCVTAHPVSNREIDAICFLLYLHPKHRTLRLSGSVLYAEPPGMVMVHEGVEFALVAQR